MLSKQNYTTRNDSNRELYELFHINVTYMKEKRHLLERNTVHGIHATGNQLEMSRIQQI